MKDSEFGPDAWEIWHSLFKDGDEVIAILEDDRVIAGKIKAEPLTCVIKRTGLKPVEIDWDDIRFIAHDGFPVKKLLGADGNNLIENTDTHDTRKFIRQVLTKRPCRGCATLKTEGAFDSGLSYRAGRNGFCAKCAESVQHGGETKTGYSNDAVFGDPFIIEDVSARLLNPGNVYLGRGKGYKGWAYEEVLVLGSKDGAAGLLYDLQTVYHFESAN